MGALYSIIIPLFNEESVIEETYKRLKIIMDSTESAYELILINDGSTDKTFDITSQICLYDKNVKLLNFSRNFGHQNAITAGMDYSEGDALVVIDADLQDPPYVILDMIKKWKDGFEVVYGKRIKRQGEKVFKKFTAKIFYRILRSLADIEIPTDARDFRLIDRKVCDAVKTLGEQNRYMRGLVSWVGFKQTSVEYVREERFAGETKYSLKKMLKFAADGITSFSLRPLRLSAYAGLLMLVFSFFYLIWLLIKRVIFQRTVIFGWSSVVSINMFFCGITLVILGILGEYIGRIFDEVKQRPLYIIRDKYNFGDKKDE